LFLTFPELGFQHTLSLQPTLILQMMIPLLRKGSLIKVFFNMDLLSLAILAHLHVHAAFWDYFDVRDLTNMKKIDCFL
jgi:hypothetical protein